MPLSCQQLRQRALQLRALQRPCQLCPRRCGVDRRREPGFCALSEAPEIASVCAHLGEEPALSGEGGAGTVFLTGCTMRCGFCQNHQISHPSDRRRGSWLTSAEALAGELLELQRRGCHNVEWVSPTSQLPGLVEALALARDGGLDLPLVYNTNGFERVRVLRLLEGVVDIYLPDAKYARDDLARSLSLSPGYVAANRRALAEMWRQVGPLQLEADTGLARRGMVVRHLVLPGQLENTREVLSWIRASLGPDAWISLMSQYYPAHLDRPGAGLKGPPRRLTPREYRLAVAALDQAGLDNGWVQELEAWRRFRPNFFAQEPFEDGDAGAGEKT